MIEGYYLREGEEYLVVPVAVYIDRKGHACLPKWDRRNCFAVHLSYNLLSRGKVPNPQLGPFQALNAGPSPESLLKHDIVPKLISGVAKLRSLLPLAIKDPNIITTWA